MTMPSDEYNAYLKANIGRFSDLFDHIIKRTDYTNLLLGRILTALGGYVPGPTPGPTPSFIMSNKPSFVHGQKDVTTAGTAVQVTTSTTKIPDGIFVTIIAKPGNTGTIYIGKSKSEAEETNRRFDGISAGLAISLYINDLSDVWVNSDTDGEGISYIYESDQE